jgi:hypothetical protein
MTDNQVRPANSGTPTAGGSNATNHFLTFSLFQPSMLKYEAFKEANPWVIERPSPKCVIS